MSNNVVLLVADDREHARKAARLAGETVRQVPGAKLSVIVAYAPVPDWLGRVEAELATGARQSRAEAVADALRREIGAVPGPIETELLEGSLAQAAQAIAQTRRNDRIIQGAGAPGWWGRLVARFRSGRGAGRPLHPAGAVR